VSVLQSFFVRIARRGIFAAAEALFPENDYGAPDFRSTDLVRRTFEYLEELPNEQRRLILTLFVFVEVAAPFLFFTPHSFSTMSVRAREVGVRALRRSRFLPMRIVGDALKATMTMMYMSHADALAFIGAHSACSRPSDPLAIPVRPGVLPGVRHEA
jgi:hypothetical protein